MDCVVHITVVLGSVCLYATTNYESASMSYEKKKTKQKEKCVYIYNAVSVPMCVCTRERFF